MLFNFKKQQNFFPKIWQENNEKNNTEKRKTKIFVAVSGGVDSSVALAILQEKGYAVEGVFFRKFNPDKNKCQSEKKDAEDICQKLNVPFHFLDLEEEYKRKVLNYFIEGYEKGETPNPDIFCNKFIKFGAFLEYAEKNGADFIATGHYAKNFFENTVKKQNILSKIFYKYYSQQTTPGRLPKSKSVDNKFIKNFNKHFLLKAKDKKKDQTYFLSMLSQKQLAKSIFPLGDLQKKKVRKLAKKYGLFTATKKDSQGICFLGEKIKLADFLKEYIPAKKGNLLNEDGEVIGEHDGVPFYTIGQRYGFTIFPKFKTPYQKKLFVIRKNAQNNTLVISENHIKQKKIIIKNINLISNEINFKKVYQVRIRYRGELINTLVKLLPEGKLELNLFNEHTAIAVGQIAVLYDQDICVGAGEIV